ncbi:hypothetical protein [Thiocystis violacea]|nr:hypothetical protein [Thiocystis violacea]
MHDCHRIALDLGPPLKAATRTTDLARLQTPPTTPVYPANKIH